MSREAIEAHILRRYEISKQLGHGAYGIVWRAEDRRTRQVVALKKIFDAFQNASDAQRTFREILFLLRVDHPNIIKLINVHRALNDRDIYLVFEYMSADLHTVIRAGILTDIHKEFIIYQLLATLKYLHSAEILHRDMKPSNVLVNADCSIKLADFGLARSILSLEQERRPVLTDYIATRWYRPPEILLGSTRYTKGVDMWAVGCILGEVILGKPIFPGRSTAHQLELILEITGEPSFEEIAATNSQFAETMLRGIRRPEKRTISKLLPQATPEAIDLMEKLLRFNPNERLSAEQALQHPYVIRFTSQQTQPVAPGPITISLPDDTRYTVDEYRRRLYSEMAAERRRSRAVDQEGDKGQNVASGSASVQQGTGVRRQQSGTSSPIPQHGTSNPPARKASSTTPGASTGGSNSGVRRQQSGTSSPIPQHGTHPATPGGGPQVVIRDPAAL
eukprot:gene4958-3556_t